MSVRVRFAPSPTGLLHVGNVRTALYNWLFARQKEGVFILRVEDTDVARSEQRFENQLLKDLQWLGLNWDEGLQTGGAYGPYRQTERFDLYRKKAAELLEKREAYYCFCSAEALQEERRRQLEAGGQPRYSGKCRSLDPHRSAERVGNGEPATVRLKVRSGKVGFDDLVFGRVEVDCNVIGDFILTRSDGSAQYNFAVVVDDLSMDISHVVRGEGHLSNTHRQLLVYEALHEHPPMFAHLSTILGKDGAKLSKRHGAASIDEFRRRGYLPEALLNYLALLGWAPQEDGREILALPELISEFDLTRVNRHPAVFDVEKLEWVNRSHLRRQPPRRLAELALPFLQEQGWVGPSPTEEVMAWLEGVVDALIGYLNKMEDIVEAARIIFRFDAAADLKQPETAEALSHEGAAEVICAFNDALAELDEVTLEAYKDAVKQVKSATGQKGKNLFHPIRVAITSRSSGPELDKLTPILERGSQLDLPTPVVGVRRRVESVAEQLP